MNKSFKIRIYPNLKQQILINKTFDCTRYLYNFMLNLKQKLYDFYGISLNYNNMSKILTELKKHKLAKTISNVSWYEFVRQLEYKCLWYDKKFVKINTYFASSQICSNCGYKNSDVKNLDVREWTCPECNQHHDRDINAATNILNQGLTLI